MRSKSEERENGSKGGKASGEARSTNPTSSCEQAVKSGRKRSKAPPPTPFFTVSDKSTEAQAQREKNGFTVPFQLPSLNEYINACRTNRYKGAKLKEVAETAIIYAIQQALQSGQLRRPIPPIRLAFVWHEKTKRRDADNIASAKKYILDAMQTMNIIPNDSRKYVLGFTDEIADDDRDYVEVGIIEAKPGGGGA